MKNNWLLFLSLVLTTSAYGMEQDGKAPIYTLPKEIRIKILSLVQSSNTFVDAFKKVQQLRLVSKEFKSIIDNLSTKRFFIAEFERVNPGQAFSELIIAISHGNVDTVKALIKAGIGDIQKADPSAFDTVPLIHALNENRPEMVKLLLQAGVNPNALTQQQGGPAALHIAVRNDNKNDKIQMVEDLIQAGTDINAKVSGDWTPLITAVAARSISLVKYLLENKADPTRSTSEGKTALQIAQEIGQIPAYAPQIAEIIELLKKYGATT